MINKKLRKFGAAVTAAMILLMSGCNFTSDDSSHSYRAVSSRENSSETVTSMNSDSDITSQTAIIPDVSLPAMSLPDISVPTISIPSFSVPAFGTESSSTVSSETTSEEFFSSSSSSSTSSSGFAPISGETQTVGNSDIGYLDIPADFLKFVDVVPNTDLQYSDKSATTIFTMNTTYTAGDNPTDVELAAQLIAKNIQDEGAEGVTGARVTVAGKYDAIQVYGYWSGDDTFLVIDLFEADGKIIYLSVEFPSENIDIVSYLDTYHR